MLRLFHRSLQRPLFEHSHFTCLVLAPFSPTAPALGCSSCNECRVFFSCRFFSLRLRLPSVWHSFFLVGVLSLWSWWLLMRFRRRERIESWFFDFRVLSPSGTGPTSQQPTTGKDTEKGNITAERRERARIASCGFISLFFILII